MVRQIVQDPIFLARRSEPATETDLAAAQDLLDTLRAHREGCVGMAANMIGVAKRIIVFDHDGSYMTMFNPEIVKCAQPYETEEGCLSLLGTRRTKRFRVIMVRWLNTAMQPQKRRFEGYAAQIIQHELDHCAGILI